MTRKHFAAIAAILASERAAHQRDADPRSMAAVDLVAERLADTLATFNGNFDRARFLAACREPR